MNGIAEDARVWWDAPYMLHPANPDEAWCGRQQVYKMAGAPWGVWQPMSSDLTANVQPGLQWRAVTALAGSPADADVVAAGTSDGRVWWTANGGAFWQELTAGLPGQFITDLAFLHPDTLVCTVSGYRNAQYTPHIFKRPLFGGGDWTPITGDLPHHPINHVEVLNDSILTIATDAGVYWTSNGGENWSPVGNLPTMPVYDLTVDTIADRLVAGTFARSIWSFPLDSLLPPAPVNPPSSIADAAERPAWRVYPNPVRDILTIDRQADIAELFLTNQSGQVVKLWSGEEVGGELDLAFLPAGIYILSIRTENGDLHSQQVVKE